MSVARTAANFAASSAAQTNGIISSGVAGVGALRSVEAQAESFAKEQQLNKYRNSVYAKMVSNEKQMLRDGKDLATA